MTFIIGLGNPGDKYKGTRHNVGQIIIDKLAEKFEIQNNWKESRKGSLFYNWSEVEGEEIELVKTQTYMNESGKALKYIKKKHPKIDFSKLFIVHDDLDLELGNYKIQFGKGPKVHNGLLSIYQHLGTDQFWHVRIGVDARGGDRSISPDKYVLGKFRSEEKKIFNKVSEEVAKALLDKISNQHAL